MRAMTRAPPAIASAATIGLQISPSQRYSATSRKAAATRQNSATMPRMTALRRARSISASVSMPSRAASGASNPMVSAPRQQGDDETDADGAGHGGQRFFTDGVDELGFERAGL